jgi:hypothetical protein
VEDKDLSPLKSAILEDHSLRDRDFDYKQKAILHLAAVAATPKEISAHLDLPLATVKQILGSISAREEIERIQMDIFGFDQAKIFKSILPKAVNVALGIMMDENAKEAIKADVAFKFMDRALGKPVQEIKQESGGLKELFEKLDQIQKGIPKGATIDADFVEVKEEQKDKKQDILDPIDKWAEENL